MRLPLGQNGFVLIAVIWLCGLIAALAAGLATRVRIEALSAASSQFETRAGFIADGLVRLNALNLAINPQPALQGAEVFCNWMGQAVAGVSIQDQTGLVDLNAAPPQLFALLLKGLGVRDADAARLSAELVDFRDGDSVSEAGGAEPSLYPQRDHGPKNAALEAIEEVDQLPSMTESLYRRLLPFVTVHSSQPGLDPLRVPLALRQVLEQPLNGPFTGDLASFTAGSQQIVYGITVRIWPNRGDPYAKKAIVVLLRQPERPFAVLSWQQLHAESAQGQVPAATDRCFNSEF